MYGNGFVNIGLGEGSDLVLGEPGRSVAAGQIRADFLREDARAGALGAVHRAALVLMAGRRPPVLDGDTAGPLGARSLTLSELRALVLDPVTPAGVKDEVWRALLEQVRLSWGAWATVCTWLALPGLGRKARQIRRQLAAARSGGEVSAEDVESELVAGFLQALRSMTGTADGRPRVFARLLDAAARYARRLLDYHDVRSGPRHTADLSEARESSRLAVGGGHGQIWPGAAHPEAVLARAVMAGVIRAQDGDLIARTRLERHSLTDEAAHAGVSVAAMSSRRRRAELAVAAAVRADRI